MGTTSPPLCFSFSPYAIPDASLSTQHVLSVFWPSAAASPKLERRRLVVGVRQVPPGSVDSVEFLVKPADQIVLYRSVSRDTLFLYPLQQPVSDQGKLKERLEGE